MDKKSEKELENIDIYIVLPCDAYFQHSTSQ